MKGLILFTIIGISTITLADCTAHAESVSDDDAWTMCQSLKDNVKKNDICVRYGYDEPKQIVVLPPRPDATIEVIVRPSK
jgi:hypothetical protein